MKAEKLFANVQSYSLLQCIHNEKHLSLIANIFTAYKRDKPQNKKVSIKIIKGFWIERFNFSKVALRGFNENRCKLQLKLSRFFIEGTKFLMKKFPFESFTCE